jgi:hypothetical protein
MENSVADFKASDPASQAEFEAAKKNIGTMANLLSTGDKDKKWIELLRGLLQLKLKTADATPARPSKGYDSKR